MRTVRRASVFEPERIELVDDLGSNPAVLADKDGVWNGAYVVGLAHLTALIADAAIVTQMDLLAGSRSRPTA
jgi:hypothetical protein